MKRLFKKKKSPEIILGKYQRAQPRKKKKRKKQRKTRALPFLFKIGFFLCVFLYGAFVVYLFFFSSFFRVTVDFSLKARDGIQDDVRLFTKSYTEEKVFYFFPRNTFFLFDEEYFQSELRERFPLLRDIEVKKYFSNRYVDISGKERESHIVWCPYRGSISQQEEGQRKEDLFQDENQDVGQDDASNQEQRSQEMEEKVVIFSISLS